MWKPTRFAWGGLAMLAIAPVAFAQPPDTSAPAEKHTESLIQQLGDDNPHLRDAAIRELRKAGRGALPALKSALNCSDPQIRDSAEMLLAEADGRRSAQALAAARRSSVS